MTNAITQMPDPNSYMAIGWLIAAIFGLAVMVNIGLSIWQKLRPHPPVGEVFQTIAMCRQIHSGVEERIQRNDSAVGGIRKEMQDLEHRLNTTDEERSVKIHDRINDVEKQTSRILGILERKGHA